MARSMSTWAVGMNANVRARTIWIGRHLVTFHHGSNERLESWEADFAFDFDDFSEAGGNLQGCGNGFGMSLEQAPGEVGGPPQHLVAKVERDAHDAQRISASAPFLVFQSATDFVPPPRIGGHARLGETVAGPGPGGRLAA